MAVKTVNIKYNFNIRLLVEEKRTYNKESELLKYNIAVIL